MAGITALDELLKSMSPELQPESSPSARYQRTERLSAPEYSLQFSRAGGLTLILPFAEAEAAGLPSEGRFRQITLTVHSSLDAVD